MKLKIVLVMTLLVSKVFAVSVPFTISSETATQTLHSVVEVKTTNPIVITNITGQSITVTYDQTPGWISIVSDQADNCGNPIQLSANQSCNLVFKVNPENFTDVFNQFQSKLCRTYLGVTTCSSTPISITADNNFTVSGTVTSAETGQAFLANISNLGGEIKSSSVGQTFNFPVQNGKDYELFVSSSEKGKTCFFEKDAPFKGKINGKNVDNVNVVCKTDMYQFFVTVEDYLGSNLNLVNKLTDYTQDPAKIYPDDKLQITKNGTYSFKQTAPSNNVYDITVTSTGSDTESCIVKNGEGTIQYSDVNISVVCSQQMSFTQYPLQGSVSGLKDSDLILKNMVTGEKITIKPEEAIFKFKTLVNGGGAYDIQVDTNPNGLTCGRVCPQPYFRCDNDNKNCVSGIQGCAEKYTLDKIPDIQINCTTKSYSIRAYIDKSWAEAGYPSFALINNNDTDKTTNTIAFNDKDKDNLLFKKEAAYDSSLSVEVIQQPVTSGYHVEFVDNPPSGIETGTVKGDVDLKLTLKPLPTLSFSPDSLALSRNAPYPEYGYMDGDKQVYSGKARWITVTNNTDVPVTNIKVMSKNFPSGTQIIENAEKSCVNSGLAPGKECIIMVQPGEVASCKQGNDSDAISIPRPSIELKTAENSNAQTIYVDILDYGCDYAGGYIFDLDDRLSGEKSLHGKVMAKADTNVQAYSWYPYTAICGISDLSSENESSPPCTVVTDSCNGRTDGECNSLKIKGDSTSTDINIVTHCPVNDSSSSYKWYVPAVCELTHNVSVPQTYDGVSNVDFSIPCGTNDKPLIQTIYKNIYLNGYDSTLDGLYWSSTETREIAIPSGNAPYKPAYYAWRVLMRQSTSNGSPYPVAKNTAYKIRCVRRF
jgi:hypothetical protein